VHPPLGRVAGQGSWRTSGPSLQQRRSESQPCRHLPATSGHEQPTSVREKNCGPPWMLGRCRFSSGRYSSLHRLLLDDSANAGVILRRIALWPRYQLRIAKIGAILGITIRLSRLLRGPRPPQPPNSVRPHPPHCCVRPSWPYSPASLNLCPPADVLSTAHKRRALGLAERICRASSYAAAAVRGGVTTDHHTQ
jgi:hypothetical protein